MEKKIYQKPQTEVYDLAVKHTLMATSTFVDVKDDEFYSSDDDILSHEENSGLDIW